MMMERKSMALLLMLAVGLGCRGKGSLPAPPIGPAFGQLQVMAVPDGAMVYIDGKKGGPAPLSLYAVRLGVRRIKVEKPGYFPITKKVTVRPFGQAQLTVRLKRWRAGEKRAVGLVPCAEVVFVPPGKLVMGSKEWRKCSAGDRAAAVNCRLRRPGPPTRVILSRGFWMWRTEVTQEQFRTVMGYNPSKNRECWTTCPVEQVNWHEAAAFANALSKRHGQPTCYKCKGNGPGVRCSVREPYLKNRGKFYYRCPGWRLPTEAEWEHAARLGDKGGQNLKASAWVKENTIGRPYHGATRNANALGLYDLLGNVREWCYAEQDSRYRGGWVTDPAPAVKGGDQAIARGGSFDQSAALARPGVRFLVKAPYRARDLGFRIVAGSDAVGARLLAHDGRVRARAAPFLKDRCPFEEEDLDGHDDADGCPDPDNDGDGICDNNPTIQRNLARYSKICTGKDLCPDLPETKNGYQDADGCPDSVNRAIAAKAVLTRTKIVLNDKVRFKSGSARIRANSLNLLNSVVQLLFKYKHVKQLRIEGHTDDQGPAWFNLKISRRRAKAVKAYLVAKGIAAGRLEARGYGEGRPLQKNCAKLKSWKAKARCRAVNRRVEFKVR